MKEDKFLEIRRRIKEDLLDEMVKDLGFKVETNFGYMIPVQEYQLIALNKYKTDVRERIDRINNKIDLIMEYFGIEFVEIEKHREIKKVKTTKTKKIHDRKKTI